MSAEHEGRVALVTGASRGIGRATAEVLSRRGASVVVHGHDLDEAADVAEAIRADGGRAHAVAGPIDVPETSERAVAAAVEHFGRLDTLVTSAGVQRYGDVLETSLSTWNEVFGINVTGVFLAARAALPSLRSAGSGSVVLVASVQGTATQGRVAAYTATKGALHAFARSMAVDEAAHGVRVNSVSPGSVDTPMLRAAADLFASESQMHAEDLLATWGRAHPLGRVARPVEVGEVVAFLAGPRAGFVTGTDVRVDGGLVARLAVALPESSADPNCP